MKAAFSGPDGRKRRNRLVLLLIAAGFALAWGLPKALYSRDFGLVWLIFVASVCGAWLIFRPLFAGKGGMGRKP